MGKQSRPKAKPPRALSKKKTLFEEAKTFLESCRKYWKYGASAALFVFGALWFVIKPDPGKLFNALVAPYKLPKEVQALKNMMAERNEVALHVLSDAFYTYANTSPGRVSISDLNDAIIRLEEKQQFAKRLLDEANHLGLQGRDQRTDLYLRQVRGLSLGLDVLREYFNAFTEDKEADDSSSSVAAGRDRRLFSSKRLQAAYVSIVKAEKTFESDSAHLPFTATDCLKAVRHVRYANAFRYKELFKGTLRVQQYEASRRDAASDMQQQMLRNQGSDEGQNKIEQKAAILGGQWKKMLSEAITHLGNAVDKGSGDNAVGEPDMRRAITNLSSARVNRARVLLAPVFSGRQITQEARVTAMDDLKSAAAVADVSNEQLNTDSDMVRLSIVRANFAEATALLAMLEESEEDRSRAIAEAEAVIDKTIDSPQECHGCVYAMRGQVKAIKLFLAKIRVGDADEQSNEVLRDLNTATNKGYSWSSSNSFECLEQVGELKAVQLLQKDQKQFERSVQEAMRGVYSAKPAIP